MARNQGRHTPELEFYCFIDAFNSKRDYRRWPSLMHTSPTRQGVHFFRSHRQNALAGASGWYLRYSVPPDFNPPGNGDPFGDVHGCRCSL